MLEPVETEVLTVKLIVGVIPETMLSIDANGTTKHKMIRKIITGFIDLPPETMCALIAEISSSFYPSPFYDEQWTLQSINPCEAFY